MRVNLWMLVKYFVFFVVDHFHIIYGPFDQHAPKVFCLMRTFGFKYWALSLSTWAMLESTLKRVIQIIYSSISPLWLVFSLRGEPHLLMLPCKFDLHSHMPFMIAKINCVLNIQHFTTYGVWAPKCRTKTIFIHYKTIAVEIKIAKLKELLRFEAFLIKEEGREMGDVNIYFWLSKPQKWII